MSVRHVDHPGEWRWFHGHGPATVVGLCPHVACRHHAQTVIAHGPSLERYELVRCDVDDGCDGHCRAWTDGGYASTTPWLFVLA